MHAIEVHAVSKSYRISHERQTRLVERMLSLFLEYRQEVLTRMKVLAVAYMPYKGHVHRIWTDLAQPWVVGYHRNVFVHEFWRYVDIDLAEKARRLR